MKIIQTVIFLLLPAIVYAQNGYTFYETKVKTNVLEQPQINFMLTLPKNVESFSDVKGVIAFCTWESDVNRLKLCIHENYTMVQNIVALAEKHKLAIVSWTLAKPYITGKNFNELTEEEYKADDARFWKLSDAWETGMKNFIERFEIPGNGYLLYGISNGAQWAHRLALRKPEYFAAVHIHISSGYDKPTEIGKKTAWLITSGELDVGIERTKSFFQEAQKMGYPIVFLSEKNLAHDASKKIYAMENAWFDYVLENKGNQTRINEGIFNPPYYGNEKIFVAFPSSEKDNIPADRRTPIPTRKLAETWGPIEE